MSTTERLSGAVMAELTEDEFALLCAVRNAREALADVEACKPGFQTPDGSKVGLFLARRSHALRGFRRESELLLSRLVGGSAR